ncbi:hypothetical protein ACGU38_38985, partial [Streptomyces rochei]
LRAQLRAAGVTTLVGSQLVVEVDVDVARTAAAALADAAPTVGEHLWTGRTFTAGWGSSDVLDVTLVDPQLVVEVVGDIARGTAGTTLMPEPFAP